MAEGGLSLCFSVEGHVQTLTTATRFWCSSTPHISFPVVYIN